MRVNIFIWVSILNLLMLQAESNSRFPLNPNARWKITNISYFPIESEERILEKYEYFIQSDTLINSFNYYKLYKSGVAWYDTPFYFDSIYVGAIRDEDNKIYFVKKNETTEIFLLDFNLKLGNVIHSSIGKDFVVNFIDTMTDGRKRIYSIPEACGGCCTTIELIEGIGHSGGLIEDPPCEHIGFYGNYLNCFTINDESIYQNEMSLVNCGNFFTAVDHFKVKTKIDIYPVPSFGKLTLEISNIPETKSLVDIFNYSGSLVYSKELQIIDKTEIDIHHLKKGIYFIRLINNNFNLTKQIIIE